jgi:hypothetical protein
MVEMHSNLASRATRLAISSALLGAWTGIAFAQSPPPKQTAPNEAKQILQDSKKVDPETPKEIAECMKNWGPQTEMTKEEWAASCRRTLQYFPEKP